MSRWIAGPKSGASAGDAMRHAAWVARCVGRRSVAHLAPSDLELLVVDLSTKKFARGDVVFVADQMSAAVSIVRSGPVGLFAGVGAARVILSILPS